MNENHYRERIQQQTRTKLTTNLKENRHVYISRKSNKSK